MVIVFDLNGTLTDPSGIGEPWSVPELGDAVLDQALQLAFVDTVLGEFHEFSEHIAAAIRTEVARRDLDVTHIEAAIEAAQKLEPRGDAELALEALQEAGHRLIVLTNSGAEAGRTTLEAAGLAERFDMILGVDAVRKFKPHRDVYEHAVRQLGVSAPEITMVAAHAWDITGAKHAGLRGAWVNREGTPFPATGIAPDLTARSVGEIAMSMRAADQA